MEGYVSVATFLTEVEAQLAQATLAAAGIESFLKYEDTGHMIPPLQQSEGVEVYVDPKDFEESKIILSSRAFEPPDK